METAVPKYPLNRGSETILLVEDEAVVREVIGQILEINGYIVLEAGSGPEALLLSQRQQTPIHLVLSDVVMPGMSGVELAVRLQAQRPEIKVLFMSGHPESSIVHHGMLNPGVAFIQKPFRANQMIRKIRELLDGLPAAPA